MSVQVLVIKPKALNAADRKSLRDAGIVCVEAADPSQVRLLTPEGPVLSSNDLFMAAITAIASDKYSDNTNQVFTRNLAALVKASNAEAKS